MLPDSRLLAGSFSFSDPALALGDKLGGGAHDELDDFEHPVMHGIVRESHARSGAGMRTSDSSTLARNFDLLVYWRELTFGQDFELERETADVDRSETEPLCWQGARGGVLEQPGGQLLGGTKGYGGAEYIYREETRQVLLSAQFIVDSLPNVEAFSVERALQQLSALHYLFANLEDDWLDEDDINSFISLVLRVQIPLQEFQEQPPLPVMLVPRMQSACSRRPPRLCPLRLRNPRSQDSASVAALGDKTDTNDHKERAHRSELGKPTDVGESENGTAEEDENPFLVTKSGSIGSSKVTVEFPEDPSVQALEGLRDIFDSPW
ncbi:hypothetical protein B0H13DRAFT_1865624 [Mycena leptocephala]|nr:hypothetical protein B0H13DRAFT_1865624 [Mycena leptocephala]